jgi:hypothetical protein
VIAPEKLLAKLERAANGLRWWLWIERNQGSIMFSEGEWTATGEVKGRFFYGRGKTLAAAMQEIDRELAERTRWNRVYSTFDSQKGAKGAKVGGKA